MPEPVRRYLAHTSDGRGIREIAREAGCHASTVLRQVRKTEAMRDDPLVDRALTDVDDQKDGAASADTVLDAAITALKRICQPGAVMLYSEDLPQPAIVQTQGDENAKVLGKLSVNVAAAMVLRAWVSEEGGASVKRYRVTSEGRAALSGLVAARDQRASRDMELTLDSFADPKADRRSRDRSQSNGPGSESPLVSLARRRGSDGQPFLTPEFVAAGDRLYEDFQISGFDQNELLGWERPEALDPFYARQTRNARQSEAIARTLDAIKDLGLGLSDVALRCCCLREGMEATEKRMGWSARSGKIVLRIALQRLSLFYAATLSKEGVLIG
jgi:hypothetical protein